MRIHGKKIKKCTLLCLVSLSAVLAITQPVRADLISVAFNSPNSFGPSPLISGPDPASTAANPLFGSANVWNNLNIPFGTPITNPGWNNLVDSTGAATSASLSITGTVGAVDFYAFYSGLDPLRSEAVVWNDFLGGSSSISTTIDWALSGLAPNATYDMCVYGSEADFDRSFNMTIEGTTLNVPTYNYATPTTTPPPPGCVLFSNLKSNGSGMITGVGTGIGAPSHTTTEANWSGFELVQVPEAAPVPEPSSLVLLGTGAVGVLGSLRKRLLR